MSGIISSSELAVVVVIVSIIECARNEKAPVFTSKLDPLRLLSFLADIVKSERIDKFANLEALLSNLREYVSSESAVYIYICNRFKFETVDGFFDLVEGIPNIFIVDLLKLSPNSVLCPFAATENSLIGLVLRTCYAKCQLASFEDIVIAFDQLQSFIHQMPSTGSVRILVSTDSSLQGAQIASKNKDVGSAMDCLHAYFDKGDQPLSYDFMTGLVPPRGPNPKKRYQQAMLSMASLLITFGNMADATDAVEEALKTAHQRGDNASVSQSLLLLQYIRILGGSTRSSPTALAAVQAALMQIIARTSDLKLKHLAAQARLLLARIHLFGDLRLSHGDYQFQDENSTNETTGKSVSPQDIWDQISLALLGEDVSVDVEKKVSSGFAPAPKFDPTNNKLMSSEELGSVPLQAAAISAELWMRLGLFEIAELECMRTLRVHTTESLEMYQEEALHLGTLMAILHSERGFESSLMLLFAGRFKQGDVLTAMDRSMDILNALEQLIPLSPTEPQYRRFRGASHFVKLYRAIVTGCFDRALELSTTLVELYAPERPDIPPERDYIRALTIYGELLQHLNFAQAVAELQFAVHVADQHKLVVEGGEATLMHTLVQLRQYPHDLEPSLRVVKTIRELARSSTYPALERYAAICEDLIPTVAAFNVSVSASS